MRSLRTTAVIFGFLAGPAVFAETPAQDWRFAHPGATLIGGLRVKAVLDSPLVNTLIAEGTAKDPSTAAIAGMVRMFLGGVSEVRFSVRDMGKGKDPDVLALVTGVLDEAAAGALVQGKTKGKTSVRRIDANTLLLGEDQSLDEAIARLSKPATALQARSIARSKALVNYDLWLAGALPELPMTLPVLDSLRGVALGISAQNDLRVEVALETASAKVAEDLVSSARRSQTEQPALGAALQSEVDGSTARFRFVMEKDQVIQAVHQGKSGTPSSLATLLGQAPTFRSSAPEPVAPPKPQTIRIYGLDEGVRETKMEARQ